MLRKKPLIIILPRSASVPCPTCINGIIPLKDPILGEEAEIQGLSNFPKTLACESSGRTLPPPLYTSGLRCGHSCVWRVVGVWVRRQRWGWHFWVRDLGCVRDRTPVTRLHPGAPSPLDLIKSILYNLKACQDAELGSS